MESRWTGAPDAIEPIIGYRAWQFGLIEGRALLNPMSSPVTTAAGRLAWPDWEGAAHDWVTASCLMRGGEPWHVAPVEGCSCGFYAMRALDPVVQGFGAAPGIVFGRVELAGKIIEHDFGFRAERARIAEFIPLRGRERSIMMLANRLGVPMAPSIDLTRNEDAVDGVSPRGPTNPTNRGATERVARRPLRVAAGYVLPPLIALGTNAAAPAESRSPTTVVLRTVLLFIAFARLREPKPR
jgi:hypothetical protein